MASAAGTAAPRGRRRRAWRRPVLAAAGLLVVLAATTARVLVWPVEWTPAGADAIVMLAGPGNRLPVALRLAREHRAPVLVVSRGWMGYSGPCPPPTPGVRTICFEPNPGNTRGEAEYVGALARRNGWHSLILVAIRPQAVRSQTTVSRHSSIKSAAGLRAAKAWSTTSSLARKARRSNERDPSTIQ